MAYLDTNGLRRVKEKIDAQKMNKPTNTGSANQILRRAANGSSYWDDNANAQEISDAAEAWLDDHVTIASETIALDASLTVEGAAADAEAAGALVKVSDTEPSEESNRVWIDPTAVEEISVATTAELNEVSNAVGAVSSAINVLEDAVPNKVNKPQTNPNGTNGQLLKTLGNGQTEWTNVGTPTEEQVQDAVDDYLDAHPEQTTTVVDGSLTEAKFTEQTLVDIKNYVVTPQMYGAKADGSTDDTSAIQAALNAHKKVYFPQGTYKITEPIVVAYGQTIEGDSKYSAVILAVGCNAIEVVNGDAGERGTIKCVHIQGNYTADSKGVVLPNLAPGWTITNAWISGFDFGIYGYNIGSINNIYIMGCIITGKPNDAHAMSCGIHMQNTSTSQINAITIRDCEINEFAVGIRIGGIAISIVQNTIQSCEFGIAMDAGLCSPASGAYVNTCGAIISGCYMELITKSAIYLSVINHNQEITATAGFFNGVQITNNYLYKSSGDNSYAVIKFDKTTNYGYGANTGTAVGLEYSGFFIGMNHISKPGACNEFDISGCLSTDSIIMDAGAGTSTNPLIKQNCEIIASGANIFSNEFVKKVQTNVSLFPTYKSNGVTIVDEHTIQLDYNAVFIMYINNAKLKSWKFTVSASEYPVKLKYETFFRTRKDGLIHGRSYSNGAYHIDWNDNMEFKDWSQYYGYSSIAEALRTVTPYEATYHGSPEISWNDLSGFALFLKSWNEQPITITAPFIEFVE